MKETAENSLASQENEQILKGTERVQKTFLKKGRKNIDDSRK